MPSQPLLSFYHILGISRSASAEEVRRAYKQKALETHPDKLDPSVSESEKQAAETKFHQVYQAFQTLSDPEKRKAYDSRNNTFSVDPEVWDSQMKDRQEWAAKQHENYRLRMDHIREQKRVAKEEKLAQEQAEKEHAKLVEEILQEIWDACPEWAERRKLAQERKRAREQAKSPGHPIRT